MKFASFMSSIWGRAIRIIAGLALVYYGFMVLQGATGIIVGVIGLAPLVAGIFGFCIFAPLVGGPFWGKDVNK